MIRLGIIVEGRAEENFANQVLSTHLENCGVFSKASMVPSRRDLGRRGKGGIQSYSRVRKYIVDRIKEDKSPTARFTTMFDLYGIPGDFPGFKDSQALKDPYQRVQLLEQRLKHDVPDDRLIPYIQLHEFEALILAEPSRLNGFYPDRELTDLVNVATQKSPELIDDGQLTAPSKRIGAAIPEYLGAKATVGPQIAAAIGLDTLRSKCPHFGEWLAKLEGLASTGG